MSTEKTATKIKDIPDWKGRAALYRLSAPVEDEDGLPHEYVIVSAVMALFTGPETYIFPADAKGEVTSWGELPGSQRGFLDHELALEIAGYCVVESSKEAQQ